MASTRSLLLRAHWPHWPALHSHQAQRQRCWGLRTHWLWRLQRAIRGPRPPRQVRTCTDPCTYVAHDYLCYARTTRKSETVMMLCAEPPPEGNKLAGPSLASWRAQRGVPLDITCLPGTEVRLRVLHLHTCTASFSCSLARRAHMACVFSVYSCHAGFDRSRARAVRVSAAAAYTLPGSQGHVPQGVCSQRTITTQ